MPRTAVIFKLSPLFHQLVGLYLMPQSMHNFVLLVSLFRKIYDLNISRNTYPDGTLDGIRVHSERAYTIEDLKEWVCICEQRDKVRYVAAKITEKQPSEEAKKAGITLWDRLDWRVRASWPISLSLWQSSCSFWGASWEYFLVHAAVAHYACNVLTFWSVGGGVNLYPSVAHCDFLPAATLSLPPFSYIS
jgi:hypothetical protein